MGLLKRLKYAFLKFDMDKYWNDRYYEYQDLRGSAKGNLTVDENIAIYKYSEKNFEDLLPDKENLKVLDVGCGMGYYTDYFNSRSVRYWGVDVSRYCIDYLNLEHPGFRFECKDFTEKSIKCSFKPDVVLCLDVTQHIVDDKAFKFLMNQLKGYVDQGATLILTDHLKNKKYSFYEVGRSMIAYEEIFSGHCFRSPSKYRDKYIFAIS